MRLTLGTSLLCVIDVQERLLAVMPGAERLVARVARLAEAARLLGVRATLTEQGAEASRQAGGEAVAQSDLRGSTPWAVGAPDRGDAVGPLGAGTLHVAVPYDPDWSLSVDGANVPGRRAFGSTLAFDAPTAGNGVLAYDTGVLRPLWVLVQLVLVIVLMFAASRVRSGYLLPRRRLAVLTDTEPVADLTSPFDPPVVPAERVDDPNALHFIEDDPT